jgi:Uncharacterised nucleotidyltransferase
MRNDDASLGVLCGLRFDREGNYWSTPDNYSQPLTFNSIPFCTVSVDGESISTLTAEDALLHACVHAARDSFSPQLSSISDAAYLAANLKPDSWQRFQERSRSLGVRRKVLVVLRMARDLLGARFPEHIELLEYPDL